MFISTLQNARSIALFTAGTCAFTLGLGCSHTVTVKTEPPGADVFVDDEYIGQSPAQFTETTGSGGKTREVAVELDGYAPVERTVRQTETNQDVMMASILGALFLTPITLVGLAFTKQSPDTVIIPIDTPAGSAKVAAAESDDDSVAAPAKPAPRKARKVSRPRRSSRARKAPVTGGCHMDTDCKGDRICEVGVCISPE